MAFTQAADITRTGLKARAPSQAYGKAGKELQPQAEVGSTY